MVPVMAKSLQMTFYNCTGFGFVGKIGLGGSEFWERDIVGKRADYDRLISMFSIYIIHKPVVHVCRK